MGVFSILQSNRIFYHIYTVTILIHTSRYLIGTLKDKSGVDEIIVKKQLYQLLNTNRESFPCFDASNFHKFVNESS